MKFYVAAFADEKEKVRRIYQRLRRLGHDITVDWTVRTVLSGKKRDEHPEQVQEIAVRDMKGILESDIFVLLSEPADGRAKYAELGAAIVSCLEGGKPRIYVLGKETNQSVFFYHPAVTRVHRLDDILKDLKVSPL